MPSRVPTKRAPRAAGYERTVWRYEITKDLDPGAAEALRLEIRLLARRYKVKLKAFRVEAEDNASNSSP